MGHANLTEFQKKKFQEYLDGEITAQQYWQSHGVFVGVVEYRQSDGSLSPYKPSMMQDFDGYTLIMTEREDVYRVDNQYKHVVSTRKGLTFQNISGLKVLTDGQTGIKYFYAIILDT